MTEIHHTKTRYPQPVAFPAPCFVVAKKTVERTAVTTMGVSQQEPLNRLPRLQEYFG